MTKNRRRTFLSNCAACNGKRSKFVKEQEVKELLSKLTGIKVPILSDLPIANTLCFNLLVPGVY